MKDRSSTLTVAAVAPVAGRPAPIVVGVDGSVGAHAALLWAADEARLRGVPLEIVRTWPLDPPAAPTPASAFAAVDERARHVEGEVEAESACVRGDGLPVTQLVRQGSAQDVLVDASVAAGRLVVGSRGRGSVRRLLLAASAHTSLPTPTAPSSWCRRCGPQRRRDRDHAAADLALEVVALPRPDRTLGDRQRPARGR